MDKGTAKDFFSYFSGQRERNSEFTVGWLFVSKNDSVRMRKDESV